MLFSRQAFHFLLPGKSSRDTTIPNIIKAAFIVLNVPKAKVVTPNPILKNSIIREKEAKLPEPEKAFLMKEIKALELPQFAPKSHNLSQSLSNNPKIREKTL